LSWYDESEKEAKGLVPFALKKKTTEQSKLALFPFLTSSYG
jgi:hypothetical protein